MLGRRVRSNKDTFVDPSEREPEPPPVAVGEPVVFAQPAPDAVVEEAPRRPAKKQKRQAKKQKRQAMPPEYVKGPGRVGYLHPHWRKSFPDDEEEGSDRGKVVDVPDALRLYGVWRRVPGFWKILASDEGFIATEGEWVVRTPTVGYNHYMYVGCNGHNERVHNLVCRAFKGRPRPNEVSVDHMGGKELPMAERRQDNRAINLDWATAAQQRRNQGECKVYSSGEPCLVWEVVGLAGGSRYSPGYMTPTVGAAQRFPSATAAAKALGLDQGNLSAVLNGTYKTTVGTDGKRYAGEWDPDLADIAKDEEWKEKPLSTRNRLFVSNYGRIQRIYPGGREGTKHYPESTDAQGYLRVKIDRKKEYVHILVGELFWIGPKPRNWAFWDHKDRDKQNNHISNLRPVTPKENQLNTARQRDFYFWPKDDPDQWERCMSQNATARAYNLHPGHLNDVLHKRRQANGSIRKTVGGYCAAWCDEVE